MDILCAPSYRQNSTYHGLCYTSRGSLAVMRNGSMGLVWRIDPTTHRTMSERSTMKLHLASHNQQGDSNWLKEGRKERNVLFNDALNTFFLRLYGVRHMVKDHSDSEKGKPLPPHRLLFPINSKGYFICTIPQQDSTYHGLCYSSRGALAGTRNSSMGSPHEGSTRRPVAPWANALQWSCISLLINNREIATDWIHEQTHFTMYSQYTQSIKIVSHITSRTRDILL